VLGREHVVLCSRTRLAQVEEALHAAGCANRRTFGEGDGAPLGWVLVGDVDKSGRPRGLFPTSAVPLEEGTDILNVLRPLPEIEITLEGGVPLGYSSWLAEFPPLIRVLGAVPDEQKVLIDGKEAKIEEDATFRAPGWDAAGAHQVWCSGVSRSYSLVPVDRSWDLWPAHVFSSPDGGGDRLAICGPIVRPLAVQNATDAEVVGFERRALETNPILLGAVPGQVFVVRQRRDIRGAQSFASPPFDPVWALPPQPLQCDKTARRILLVGRPSASLLPRGSPTGPLVSQWCKLILDSSRKRLPLAPPEAGHLWAQYKHFARSLWRKTR
jgi:hypothetical protein